MLKVEALNQYYGGSHTLRNVAFEAPSGAVTTILGRNGVGKTTLLKCIAGLLPSRSGSIGFDGADVTKLAPHMRARLGLGYVPQGREIFPRLTVEENLLLGAFRKKARAEIHNNLAFCFECFPRLAERKSQLAGSMSGGEQQMLALGRALMLHPRILLIDEPSVGLAPVLVSRTIEKIKELKERYSLTVLMAEQNFTQALRIADRGYVIVHGKIEFEGKSADDLNNNDLIRKFYLGL